MKQITAHVEQDTIYAVVIAIDDHDAMVACLTRTFTGFNVKDAIRNANNKLKFFGYEVTEIIR